MEELTVLRKVVLGSEDDFGWEITCYEDETVIVYYEIRDGVKVEKEKYEFSSGYDLQIFKEAIKLREQIQMEDIL